MSSLNNKWRHIVLISSFLALMVLCFIYLINQKSIWKNEAGFQKKDQAINYARASAEPIKDFSEAQEMEVKIKEMQESQEIKLSYASGLLDRLVVSGENYEHEWLKKSSLDSNFKNYLDGYFKELNECVNVFNELVWKVYRSGNDSWLAGEFDEEEVFFEKMKKASQYLINIYNFSE